MDKKNIKIKIVNENNEETLINVIGEISENKKEIYYYDEKVLVTVLLNEEIIIKRKHPDYYLTLIFKEKENTFSTYEIKNPKMNLAIEVETIILKRFDRGFVLEYELKINNEYIGSFKINLKWD